MASSQGARPRRNAVDFMAEEELGVATDLAGDVVRQSGLDAGLVDVKVCAVTDIWSGLKFVIPVKNRPKK